MRARSAFLVRASAEDTSRRAIMGLFCASTGGMRQVQLLWSQLIAISSAAA